MRDTITFARALLLALTLTGCSARSSTPDPLIIMGPRSNMHPTRAGQATVVVVVRDSFSPERNVAGASVTLVAPGREPMRVMAGMDGVARFDTVPVGQYTVGAVRVGYGYHSVSLTARETCPQVVEIYLKLIIMCLFECPTPPPRATITTCPPAT